MFDIQTYLDVMLAGGCEEMCAADDSLQQHLLSLPAGIARAKALIEAKGAVLNAEHGDDCRTDLWLLSDDIHLNSFLRGADKMAELAKEVRVLLAQT